MKASPHNRHRWSLAYALIHACTKQIAISNSNADKCKKKSELGTELYIEMMAPLQASSVGRSQLVMILHLSNLHQLTV